MVEAFKDLLALTAQARDSARAGNFQDVSVLIEKRGSVLEQLSSRAKPALTDTQKVLAKEVALCINELDAEIAELVREEMDRGNREMLEIANKLRVLMAYSRGLRGNRRFDNTL
ncbi:MAG: hypothetical protein ACOX35_05165 [Bacillota bacterium]|jgi:AICAR transformylase/IMP cyclohydrolase PurH|nr:hypothetical protein [Candidatus Fermentithermobacillaceae bacterium]